MTQESKCIEYADGTRIWWLNGEPHRTDGPAVERANGTRKWYLNGKLHRTDGPAAEYADGTREWYLNETSLTFNEWLKKAIFDEEEQVMFKLEFG
jgi:hypothetical protein